MEPLVVVRVACRVVTSGTILSTKRRRHRGPESPGIVVEVSTPVRPPFTPRAGVPSLRVGVLVVTLKRDLRARALHAKPFKPVDTHPEGPPEVWTSLRGKLVVRINVNSSLQQLKSTTPSTQKDS